MDCTFTSVSRILDIHSTMRCTRKLRRSTNCLLTTWWGILLHFQPYMFYATAPSFAGCFFFLLTGHMHHQIRELECQWKDISEGGICLNFLTCVVVVIPVMHLPRAVATGSILNSKELRTKISVKHTFQHVISKMIWLSYADNTPLLHLSTTQKPW